MAQLAKAPVSKTGDSRFESWLPRLSIRLPEAANRLAARGRASGRIELPEEELRIRCQRTSGFNQIGKGGAVLMKRSGTGGTSRLHGHMRANAIAYLALFVALGGTSAWAADKITSKEIARSAVLSRHIKNKGVRTVDLANGVVTHAKLRNDAVDSNKVADNSLAATDILNGTIGAADLADGAVTTPNIADGAVTSAKLAAGAAGFTGYEFVQKTHNVNPGDTSIVIGAECPPGKKLLGGGFAVQDSKFNVTFAHAQANDTYALTAVVLPGQTITTTSQAFVEAICARINETP